MKRKNSDQGDYHAKKKVRRSQEYQDREKEIMEDFKAKRWRSVLQKSEFFYSDQSNQTIHHIIGRSAKILKNYQKCIHHFEIFLKIYDGAPMEYGSRYCSGDSINYNTYHCLGASYRRLNNPNREKSMEYFTQNLQYVRKSIGHTIFYYYLLCSLYTEYGKKEISKWCVAIVDIAHKNAGEFVKLNHYTIYGKPIRRIHLDKAYKYAYERVFSSEEFQEMNKICYKSSSWIDDHLGEAYVNWDGLSPVFQKRLEVQKPAELKRFIAFSQSMEYVLLHVKSPFATETLRHIHKFLYKV